MEQNQNITTREQGYSMLPIGAQEAIHNVDMALHKVHSIAAVGLGITSHIAETVIEVKQMQVAIQQMDLQVELMCKEYDMKIEKNKLSAQILQGQLTNYSGQMDQLLKRILDMDPLNKDQDYIQGRSELISLLNQMSANISNMFMNFIMY